MVVDPVDVLVVGAGPTGLALALQCQALGASVRVVERRREPVRRSRAIVLHPRSLEVLRPLGVNERILARADLSPSVCLHMGERQVWVRSSDLTLEGSAYPHLVLVRQADVESVLDRALAERGVAVERGKVATNVEGGLESASAVVRGLGGEERVDCRFLVGCDGADSAVRGCAGIGYSGGHYGHDVLLADVELTSGIATTASHVLVARSGLVFIVAMGEGAHWRLIATCDRACTDAGSPAVQLRRILDEAGLPVVITRLAWATRLPIRHGLATEFRRGRVLLAGDAAHVHSPAAAQGMNAGIQDAANLGWKLAVAARQGQRGGSLVDTYEFERRPVARRLIALTGAVFRAEAGTGAVASFARAVLTPRAAPVIPFVLRRRSIVDRALRVLYQFEVNYRHSPLSVDDTRCRMNRFRAGDRLPDELVWISSGSTRLHDLTSRPGFHVLLQQDAAWLQDPRLGSHVDVTRICSWPGAGAMVVRPDGYVGMRNATADVEHIVRWLGT